MNKDFWSRLTAGVIDIVMGLILCYILHWFIGFYFSSRAWITFRVGQPGTIWKGVIPWMLGIIGPYFYTLPLSFFLIFLPEAIWGWSIGKKMLGIKIVGETKDRWLRFIIKTSGAWGMTLALIFGSFELMVVSFGVGIVVILGSLHDRLTATSVVAS